MNQLSVYDCESIIAEIELKASDDGEISEEDMQALVETHATSIQKLGKMCGYMKFLEHYMTAADSEIARITATKNKAKRRLESIKGYLAPFVKAKGKPVTVESFTLSIRKSESVKLVDGFDNKLYCNKKETWTPDKKRIKDALKASIDIGGAELIKKDNLQLK